MLARMSDATLPLLAKEQPASLWELFVSDLEWGFEESQEMLESLGCTSCNPLFYPTVAILVLCVVPGRWVHWLFGQGDGPDDELPVEKDVRIQWVYMTDGPFAVAAVIALLRMLGGYDLSIVIDLAIDVAFIVGNIFFLAAIRNRDVLEIRVAILANAVFAVGMTLLLIYGLLITGAKHNWTAMTRFEWFLRALVVGFFIAAVAVYTQLWNAHTTTQWHASTCCHVLILMSAALTVWFLFVFATFLDGPTAIWSAVG